MVVCSNSCTQGLPAATVPVEQLPFSKQQRNPCLLLAYHALIVYTRLHATIYSGMWMFRRRIPTVEPSLTPVCCCCFCRAWCHPCSVRAQSVSRAPVTPGTHKSFLRAFNLSFCHLQATVGQYNSSLQVSPATYCSVTPWCPCWCATCCYAILDCKGAVKLASLPEC
jgi:hypothetical protein